MTHVYVLIFMYLHVAMTVDMYVNQGEGSVDSGKVYSSVVSLEV